MGLFERLIIFLFLAFAYAEDVRSNTPILNLDAIFREIQELDNKEVVFKGYYAEGIFFNNSDFSWEFNEHHIVMPFSGERTTPFIDKCTGKLLVARGTLHVEEKRAPRVKNVDLLYPFDEPEINCLSLIINFDS
ncbi:hypothetical protein [Pseudoalteromonas sp. BDTF-M6]|uniref:hypothetical protein n=1 Tax=Pseudoalteromonas sp. BDTF-M6 TaxID=2796132 RepID=UPI001BAFB9F0|nr:hypothetical protein [Pseudoalteromonas sp. BDTF-M6]MBS3797869.1 hypothetical protein [Pseudoalteromonas sp. BDTF-M6]